MKVDQDFSAAIFNADFEKAARLLAEGADINLVSGKNMNGVSKRETALTKPGGQKEMTLLPY